jgi:cathepsin X
VTISSFGWFNSTDKRILKQEIVQNGPVLCGICASEILNYEGGVYDGVSDCEVDHIISVVGWGRDEHDADYWIVRNSWGQYWGEGGWIYVKSGSLKIESDRNCASAVPKTYTDPDDPFGHCSEGGRCKGA